MDGSLTPANQTDQEETGASTLECPICYLAYNNVFNTPLLLPCSHTFCLECLARLCAFLRPNQTFSCPLCRDCILLPQEGILSLPANLNIIEQFPPWMQQREKVWMDGFCLCWLKKLPGDSKGKVTDMLVTVDLYKTISRDNQPQNLISTRHPRPVHRVIAHFLLENCCNLVCATVVVLVLVMLPVALILGMPHHT